MNRRKWLIVAALALVDLIVLAVLASTVIRSMRQASPASGPTRTPTMTPTPSETPIPTWTPTSPPTPRPTSTPEPTETPTMTPTPWPTSALTASPAPGFTPSPTQTLPLLENPTFEGVTKNDIPGWQTGSFVNWSPGEEFDAEASYAAPRFLQAFDQKRWIDGPTLKVDTAPWTKLRAWVFQTVELEPGSRVQFTVQARGFVKELSGGYIFKAGVNPTGGKCENAQWGGEKVANQEDGVVELASPKVVVDEGGQVTVCMFAETQFAQEYHAAYFDNAELTTSPPE